MREHPQAPRSTPVRTPFPKLDNAVNDQLLAVEPKRSSERHHIMRRFELNRKEFDDPRLEWRRLFCEVFGTFFLVVVAAGAGVVNAVSLGAVGRIAAVVAPGVMVMAVILFMGAVSGAHLNPAVSIGFAARGDFPWKRVPGYIAAQLIGATVACVFLWLMFGKVGMLGATEPGPGISDLQAMMMELVLTLGLVSTILGTASKAQNVGTMAALAVGGYIALAGLWGSPISGASMNPARSFGPDLLLLNFAHYWVYVVGPIAGALLAVVAAYILRGPGGDEPAIQAAQGRLGASLRIPAKLGATGCKTIVLSDPGPNGLSNLIPKLGATWNVATDSGTGDPQAWRSRESFILGEQGLRTRSYCLWKEEDGRCCELHR